MDEKTVRYFARDLSHQLTYRRQEHLGWSVLIWTGIKKGVISVCR